MATKDWQMPGIQYRVAFGLLMALNFADAATTLYGFQQGLVELHNPLMDSLGLPVFLGLKLVVPLVFVLLLLYLSHRFRLRHIWAVLWVLDAYFALVIENNILMLLG